MDAFIEKFKIKELLIVKVGCWNISLRPAQITLGSLVLSLDRPCREMSGLTEDESRDLGQAFKVIQEILTKAFKPDKINYLALMMVDHQVHFHVIPRYESERPFEGISYVDKDWPKPPNVLEALDLTRLSIWKLKDFLIQIN